MPNLYKTNAQGKKILRGYVVRDDTGEIVVFQFNPNELTREYKGVYNAVDSPGAYYPEINYIRQDKRAFQLTLEFDNNLLKEKGFASCGYKNVADAMWKIAQMALPSSKYIIVRGGNKTFVEPPTCRVVMGNNIYKCKFMSVKITKKVFDKNLDTIAGTVDVECLEV